MCWPLHSGGGGPKLKLERGYVHVMCEKIITTSTITGELRAMLAALH